MNSPAETVCGLAALKTAAADSMITAEYDFFIELLSGIFVFPTVFGICPFYLHIGAGEKSFKKALCCLITGVYQMGKQRWSLGKRQFIQRLIIGKEYGKIKYIISG